jgi:hypothetical protein
MVFNVVETPGLKCCWFLAGENSMATEVSSQQHDDVPFSFLMWSLWKLKRCVLEICANWARFGLQTIEQPLPSHQTVHSTVMIGWNWWNRGPPKKITWDDLPHLGVTFPQWRRYHLVWNPGPRTDRAPRKGTAVGPGGSGVLQEKRMAFDGEFGSKNIAIWSSKDRGFTLKNRWS